jgi:hypothetical protein
MKNHFLNFYKPKHNTLACIGKQLSSWLFSQSDTYLKEIEKRTSKNVSKILTTSNSANSLKRKMKTLVTAPVDLVGAVKNSKAIVKAFPRVVLGLVLLVLVAPHADTLYTRLDFNDRVSADVWYYESYHWLFLCLGPYLKNIVMIIGVYLIFVHKSKVKNYVFAWPLMFDLGKILWLLQVDTHKEYLSITPDMYLVYGFLAGVFLIGAIDLLTYWLNHRVLAIKKRLQGLHQIAYKVDAQIIRNGFVQTMDDDVKVTEFVNY